MNNKFFNSNFISDNSSNFGVLQVNFSIDELLKLNKGKKVNVVMFFPNSIEKEFNGILEITGKDHITLSEPSTGKWNVLPINFIEYIVFDENINYS